MTMQPVAIVGDFNANHPALETYFRSRAELNLCAPLTLP